MVSQRFGGRDIAIDRAADHDKIPAIPAVTFNNQTGSTFWRACQRSDRAVVAAKPGHMRTVVALSAMMSASTVKRNTNRGNLAWLCRVERVSQADGSQNASAGPPLACGSLSLGSKRHNSAPSSQHQAR